MRTRFLLIWTMLLGGLPLAAEGQTTRPVAGIKHALIISVDGLRPDLALRADTPAIHQMLKQGSFSFWARTTAVSITLPSHTSMLTGVTPNKHGILWNSDLPLEHPIYPNFPTIFELAKHMGYTTAMAAGKSKFNTLAKPGTLDWLFVSETTTLDDATVTDAAVGIIKDHHPDVLFVHLPNVDNVGHAKGWATAEQIGAIEQADACIGRLLATLAAEKLLDSTFVLVTADHGGAGITHGPDDPRSRHIPWITTGPGIRKGLDLTTYGDLEIHTEDTFATVAYLLGIRVDRPVDGKPVMQIIDRTGEELLKEQ